MAISLSGAARGGGARALRSRLSGPAAAAGGAPPEQEYVVERLYRDAPLLILGEGSNEIQQLIIARRLLERCAV
jgi:alkylation response protein AidB-like acyl-CoA dehydrogenase